MILTETFIAVSLVLWYLHLCAHLQEIPIHLQLSSFSTIARRMWMS